MDRRLAGLVALAALLVLAGCMASTGGKTTAPGAVTAGEQRGSTTAERTVAETASATVPAPDGSTEYPYGTQFVYVDRIDASRVPTGSAEARAFGNLSERRQETFKEALDADRVAFRPEDDRRNPFEFDDEERPEYVRYQGRWYYVQVAIV